MPPSAPPFTVVLETVIYVIFSLILVAIVIAGGCLGVLKLMGAI